MNLRTLDLNLLKAFDALIDERSVTRAAERLSLTQPAVSGILNRLRDSFGDPLFVRVQRGIAPTPRALELAAPIKQVLAEIQQILTPQVFDPASADFTLSVAATDYALRAVVVPFVTALRPLAPGIRVAVLQLEESSVAERMERGQLDLALLTPQSTAPELHSRNLFEEHYACILREDHPHATADMDLDTFCSLEHAIVSLRGGGFHRATDQALAKLGRSRQVKVSVPSFVMLLDIIRTSDLMALVPSRLLEGTAGLVRLVPPLEVKGFTKTLVWHPRTHEDPGHRWVRELLAKSCAGIPF